MGVFPKSWVKRVAEEAAEAAVIVAIAVANFNVVFFIVLLQSYYYLQGFKIVTAKLFFLLFFLCLKINHF